MKPIITVQFWLLLAGTLFAWINFARELAAWLQNRACPVCVVGASANPFLTACFYGALFFTAAFVLSALLMKKIK